MAKICNQNVKLPAFCFVIQVPLGVLLKSENNYNMIDIMDHLHKYVPSLRTTEDVTFQSTGEHAVANRVHFHPIIFGGDQLTVKRARGGQKIRSNSKTEDHKLGGLVPVALQKTGTLKWCCWR